MKILHRYVLRQVTIVFGVCLLVFTFVLFVGNMLKIIDMMAKGVSGMVIVKFLILLVPFMLSYSIPISILTAVLLVFSKLSADNEITAIRASGINLKYIFLPVIVYSLFLTSLSYAINDQFRPEAIFAGRRMLVEIGVEEPMLNLVSGRFNEAIPGHVIYVESKKGDVLRHVVVYKFEGENLQSVITAEQGQILLGGAKTRPGDAALELWNGTIEEVPDGEEGTGRLNRIQFDRYNIDFNIAENIRKAGNVSKREREMNNRELLCRVGELEQKIDEEKHPQLKRKTEQNISSIKTRMHSRTALAFSCLIFVLIGMPLGVTVHRTETSIGAGISLGLVSFYYFFMTLIEVFQETPQMRPWLLMWLPNITLLMIGLVLIRRQTNR